MKKLFALFLVLMMLVSLAACGVGTDTTTTDGGSSEPPTRTVTITVKILHKDKSEKVVTITTAATTLLGALQQENLVEGVEQSAGFYIAVVDGETADWSVDQGWWCFKKGGETLMTGAADTPIADGDSFEIEYTVGY